MSPNPFTETAIFELPLSIEQNNKSFSGDFELLDMTGKVLKRDKINGLQYIFERKDLPSGIYVFRISNQNGPLSIGKLIVQ